jgi:GMP synthase (glutamine-hydrolysing)
MSMAALRLLVAEGNTLEARSRMAAQAGETPSEGYAEALRSIAPDARIDLCFPADENPKLPAPLESYDGVAVTGSALNIYKGESASRRQVDFARSVFALGVPFFGSCWGLQVATVAAGGEVGPNPRGREVAFARKVMLNEAGRVHPLHRGREVAFDAPAIHADEVLRLPTDATVTAWNALSQVQAAEIRHAGGVFWGVQYHPEFTLRDLAFILRRYGQTLVDEGFFADVAALEAFAADLNALSLDQARADLAWRLGLGADILLPERRLSEIANWISAKVRPTASERGRA